MRRTAARDALGAGHWEVVFETQDESEWHDFRRALRAGEQRFDSDAVIRIDQFCGRLVYPTTYRMRLFVPDPAGDPVRDPLDQ
ncbi:MULTISPECIES: hypothetical protein [unclassified Streptomyces]|uniref:hypothetical protein n=1 Tax=unclassified Streptomyces TaxID=2593676 RepID=UPI00382EF435